MANPSSPRETDDTTGTKLPFGIYNDGGTAEAALVRVVDAAVVGVETTQSGALAVASKTAHDVANPAAEGPILQGLYAKAAAPTNVSADGDRVNAWGLLNGAQVVNLSAAGALIPGDASNGLDVDVTRVTGTVTTSPVPATSGGLTTFMASGSDGSSILVATAQAAKASAGQLYGYFLYNPETAVTFVHFYDTAQGSVTVGTTNPLFTVQIPAGLAAHIAFTHGIAFATAITIAATTTAGGNSAPATGVSATLWYK